MAKRSFEELQEQRAHDCRLRPERALTSSDEADAFLRDRRMLTRTEDSALPSLFGACHEQPYREGRGGFAEWPATSYPWFAELAERPGVYQLAIHRGKSILMTAEAAALADPICRGELHRFGAGDGDPATLLRHLAGVGPSHLDDLRLELGWSAAHLRGVRSPLQRVGALVSRSVTVPAAGGGHRHSSELARWDQVFPTASAKGGLDDLVEAGVRAAVLAPESELRRWFSWRWDPAVVERLVDLGRVARPQPGWVSAG